MTRALTLSFAVTCVLMGCHKSQPESEPSPSAAAAPAKDTTMAGGKMATDSTHMMSDTTKMTDTTKMAPADTTSMKMPADTTMQMPADTSKK
jgi:hypothetical protein